MAYTVHRLNPYTQLDPIDFLYIIDIFGCIPSRVDIMVTDDSIRIISWERSFLIRIKEQGTLVICSGDLETVEYARRHLAIYGWEQYYCSDSLYSGNLSAELSG